MRLQVNQRRWEMLLSPYIFGESKLTTYWEMSWKEEGWLKRLLIAYIYEFFVQKAFKPANDCQKPTNY